MYVAYARCVRFDDDSPERWDKAAAVAIERASGTLRDLRVAEVTEQDLVIENGKVSLYRTKLKVSLKLED